jgi:hypothetical protein
MGEQGSQGKGDLHGIQGIAGKIGNTGWIYISNTSLVYHFVEVKFKEFLCKD